MNPAHRSGRTWRLPALIIAAGALLALLALLLAFWSKALLKDVVRQGCARHANTLAGHVQASLKRAEQETLAGRRPKTVQAAWILAAGEVIVRDPEDAADPTSGLLEQALRLQEPGRHALDGATWIPGEGGGGLLLRWDPEVLFAELDDLVSVVETDDRYGAAIRRSASSPLPFAPRAGVQVGPPFPAWQVAVGLEDPEALRDTLRFQTGLLVALAGWLLVILVGGVVVSVRRQRHAVASQEHREQFLTRAYHELQTPLALLRAAAESIERGAVERPEDLERCVEIVKREEARLTSTIRRLLRVLRLQGGAGAELSAIGDEVRDAAEEHRASLAAQGLKLELSVTAEATPLRAPRDLLGDITRELLANACKYAQSGATVRVQLGSTGTRAQLTVSDDGPGFESSPNDASSGLGLTLVEEALATCGGSLERGASSEGGAKVVVELSCQT